MGASHPAVPTEDVAAALIAKFDDSCAEAARLVREADIFLLLSGAGFSADSGLAVYADVAQVEPYKRRGLTYRDICDPRWLSEDPGLFWGFWGQCFNDYRSTAPHAGFEIIDKWASRWFRDSQTAGEIREAMGEAVKEFKKKCGSEEDEVDDPYVVEDFPGAFFAFTSNVDAHHFDWFRACEIRECHGNTELYQCADPKCTNRIWRAPVNFRYVVDQATMLAPEQPAEEFDDNTPAPVEAATVPQGVDEAAAASDSGENYVPRIGQVLGGGRPSMLRYMPGESPNAADVGFTTNRPTCPSCGGPARPAILMFGDYDWADLHIQRHRWNAWREVVVRLCSMKGPGAVRVALLELGAGGNVPTVRHSSECCLDSFRDAGADVRLIRVNPEMPFGDTSLFRPGKESEHLVLSIMGKGLDCIRRMDAAMNAGGSEPQSETASS